MKASLWGQARYVGPLNPGTGWPIPISNYDLGYGRQSYEQAIEMLELGEELGYNWISFAEHHYAGGRLTPSPMVMASYMASRVTKAKIALLGPLVPTQNPVRIAEETAMLDNLSGGRLIVGLLRGTPNEYQVVGTNPAETRDRLMEGVELLINAWTQPVPFSWEGRYYRYRTVSPWPRPLQQPHPQVYSLGTSMETAEYAASHHFGLGISYEAFDFAAESTRHYKEHCALNGWEPTDEHIVYRCRIFVAESEEEAESYRVAIEGGRRGHRPTSAALAFAEQVESTRRSNAHLGLGPAVNFMGTPDMILAQLKQCHDEVGVGVVDLGFDPPPMSVTGDPSKDARALHEKLMRSVQLFGKEILPAMQEI